MRNKHFNSIPQATGGGDGAIRLWPLAAVAANEKGKRGLGSVDRGVRYLQHMAVVQGITLICVVFASAIPKI